MVMVLLPGSFSSAAACTPVSRSLPDSNSILSATLATQRLLDYPLHVSFRIVFSGNSSRATSISVLYYHDELTLKQRHMYFVRP